MVKPEKPKLLAIILVILALGALGVAVSGLLHASPAATYYVSPAGSDSNSGTSPSSPWKTVRKINNTCFNPGDSVLFEGGQTFSDIDLEPNCSGTSGNPVTYGSYGTGRPILTDVWLGGGKHDLVFDNLELTGGSIPFSASSSSSTANYDITLEDSYIHNTPGLGLHSSPVDHDWLIQNNTIEHTGDSGILIEYSTNITITRNTIAYTGENQANISYATHDIYAKGPNLTISYNDLSHQMGDGQAVSMRFHNQYVYGNLIHDTPVAINFYDYDTSTFTPQGTSYIYDNRIWNISSNAFYYDGTSNIGVAPSVNMVIANNTFVNNSASSEMFNLSKVPSAAHITTVNNIFTGTYGSAYRGCATCTESNNDWYGGAANIPSGANDLFINPGLSAAPDFALPPGSPLIDKGTANVSGLTYTPNSDGQPLHYSGAAPDMGAVEYTSSSSIVGDLNGDGRVNVFDLSILLSHWNQTGSNLPEDLNNDGVVNVFDLSILLSHYGT